MNAILIATAALVGLPIILHLIMKQEPKRLPFPALRFLLIKRKTNQRKMKLRHFLLLAMRMLLIALFGLALFQPILPPRGLDFGITLSAEQPVAAVIVLDASPSMGYVAGGATRLSEAKRRAFELLDDLPANSKVAVIDPAEPGATWEASIGDARRRIEGISEHGVAIPVTTALAAAYQLLRTLDQESESTEPMPRLVAVFSDRTAACWDAARTDDLIKLRDAVPSPAVAHLFVDVGVEEPADVAIVNLELKPQVVPQGQAALLNATLAAAGPGVEATMRCKVYPAAANAQAVPDQTKLAVIPPNGTANASFRIEAGQLQPGLYQVELRLDTADNLAFDNVRYLTLKVAEPRKVLAVANDEDDAIYWKYAHEAIGEFDCEFKKPAELGVSLAKYEAVALFNIADPTPLWPKLLDYVENGGKLLLFPGGAESVDVAAWQPSKSDAAARLLPAAPKGIFETESLPAPRKNGVAWRLDDDALRHPMLAPFREWKLRGNIDVVTRPRRAWKYWLLEPQPDSGIVATFDDDDDAVKCHAALVERGVGRKGGKVMMLATRMDLPPRDQTKLWNDYWDTDSSWKVVFPNLLLRYLGGNPGDAVLNFTTGQAVPLPTPRGGAAKLRIEGPGVTVRNNEIALDTKQEVWRLPPSRTGQAGSFRVFTPDKSWLDGFSLNPPPEECSLVKVPAEAIEGLFGPGSVVPIDRKLAFRDVLKLKYDQPLELFPWLLIAVLLLLALEAFVANRFYRSK